jgi:ubiquinone/menaquinone biosynthesis C-methylase UbiE
MIERLTRVPPNRWTTVETVTNVYTHGHHESVLRSHRVRTAQNSAAYLLPYLSGGQSLLDIGSGPATITADLAGLVAPGRVTATEMNETTLDIARAEIARREISGVDFAVADVHALPFPDDSFDVVHAHQVLQHVHDPVQALREMRRVCQPGGVVAARDGDYAAFTWYPALPELDDWLRLYRDAAYANGGEPDAGRRLLAWAHAAGFSDVTATSSTWCYADEAGRAMWGGMWADRILKSDLTRQLLREGRADQSELERISAGWQTWAADPDGWISILHGEIIARA